MTRIIDARASDAVDHDLVGIARLTRAARTAIGADATVTVLSESFALVAGPVMLESADLREIVRLPAADFLVGPSYRGHSWSSGLWSQGYRRVSVSPIHLGGERLGTFMALTSGEAEPPRLSLMEVFARHLGAVAAIRERGPLDLDSHHYSEALEALEALDRLTMAATSFVELNEGLSQHIAPLFGAATTGIMIHLERAGVLQMLDGSFGAPAAVTASYRPRMTDVSSNAVRVAGTGQPYITNDAVADPAILPQWTTAFSLSRVLSVPLLLSGRCIGVLHLANKREEFSVDDVVLAQALSSRIASHLRYAWTLFELRRERDLERVLVRIATAAAAGRLDAGFLSTQLEDVRTSIGAEMVALEVDGAEEAVVSHGPDTTELERQLLRSAQAADAVATTIVPPSGVGDRGSVSVQGGIHFSGRRVGWFAAHRLGADQLAVQDINSIERLGSLAALAYASDRYRQQRAELARIGARDELGQDLHDDVAQLLFGAQLSLDAATETTGDAALRGGVKQASMLIARADGALRDLIAQWTRRPGLSIVDTISDRVMMVSRDAHGPIEFSFDERAGAAQDVPVELAQLVDRFAREVLLHATRVSVDEATTVHLSVIERPEATFELSIRFRQDNFETVLRLGLLVEEIGQRGGSVEIAADGAHVDVVARLAP
ncbi:GAF domain-containing protein [Agrococcus baldri]|uniref:GAF domain-containing protein n=1 Tax=Agrococcus baldri TaxID=153730 RepID=A0AA87RAS5_9MICO|nr:GAF domain-containing protein [Agrococcus baldri]GEK79639.1 hypothetical protein ABA31_09900 [Agrococcus baldri]